MTPQEIITRSCKQSGHDPETVMYNISYAVTYKNAQFLREGNSILLMTPLDDLPLAYEVHLFTADSPTVLLKRIRELDKRVGSTAGVNRIYGKAPEQTIRMLKLADVPVEKSDKPQFNWMARYTHGDK